MPNTPTQSKPDEELAARDPVLRKGGAVAPIIIAEFELPDANEPRRECDGVKRWLASQPVDSPRRIAWDLLAKEFAHALADIKASRGISRSGVSRAALIPAAGGVAWFLRTSRRSR